MAILLNLVKSSLTMSTIGTFVTYTNTCMYHVSINIYCFCSGQIYAWICYEEEEEEETLFDPKSTNVQITIPHISDIQFKQLCTHIYRHYVHKHSS